MTARERFRATLAFQPLDRPFRWEAPAVWPSTIREWHRQGLPTDITCSNITDSGIYDYFAMDRVSWLPFEGGWIGDPYYPMFERTVLDDNGVHEIIIDTDGITKKLKKLDPDTSMPQFIRFPVESRMDYERKILPRYDASSPGRFPSNWQMLIKEYAVRNYPLGMFVIGPFGHLRNLMGDEVLMYKFYDDPSFIDEIMTHWKDFYLGFMGRVFRDVVPDFIMVWEDMCYRSGPLISPQQYRERLLEPLGRVIDSCVRGGVQGIVIDNDGDCSKMLPLYLECGANAFYPFEVQSGMDVLDIRKRYGPRFTIIGGIDKRALSVSEEAIRTEVDRRVPRMIAQGGYIPMLDHSVPTNVTLARFRYFLEWVRNVHPSWI